MALTRITSGVISSNVVTSEKLQNSIIQARHIQAGALTTDLFEDSANAAAVEIRVNANVDIVQDNVVATQANVDTLQDNVNTTTSNISTLTSSVNTIYANVNLVQDNVATTVLNINQVQSNVEVISSNLNSVIDGTVPFTGPVTMQDNLTVQGNLIVVGAQVDLGVGTATIDDNFIVVSANLTGTPATDSGIIINRGVEGNVFIGDHIAEDGVVFALSQSPHDNATISIQEYLDVHANAFHAESDLNFSRAHFAHVDDESTGMIIDTTNSHIKFVVGGTEVANLDASANLVLNDGRLTGNPNSDGDRNAIDLDVDEESDVVNSISMESVNSIFFLIDKNNNGDNPNAYIGVFNDVADLSASTRDTAIFSIRDNGEVFANSVSMAFDANIAGVGVMANDYVTYTRLNANLNSTNDNIALVTGNVNSVQDNVTALTGGGTLSVPFSNTNTSVGTSNVFFIGSNVVNQSNIVVVSLDGVVQTTLDYVPNFSNDTVQFTDASIPAGIVFYVQTLTPASA